MQNITNVIDSTNGLQASQMKEVCGEEENLILSTGMTLSESDLGQIAKAIAVYSSRGDFYNDTGIVNAINLSPVGLMKYPQTAQIVKGTRVRFSPAFDTNSTSVTLSIASGSTYPVSTKLLEDGDSVSISPGLDSGKIYEATLTTRPDGSLTHWWVNSFVEEHFLRPQSVGISQIQQEAVITSKILDENVTNAKLAEDIQLNKISGGTLAFSKLNMQGTVLRYGTVSEPNVQMSADGFRFAGVGSAGNITPDIKIASYSIASQVASATLFDSTTRTADGHEHRLGQGYTFATPFDTEIPNGRVIFLGAISYIATTTGQTMTAPVILQMGDGATNQEISTMSVHHARQGSADYPINTSQPVYLTILYWA